jgi:hypothetical protein
MCRELKKEGVPVPLVFLLWDMMCEKHLYFFDGQDVAFMRTGFKGLPQGSVLSPFMYNFYTRLVEACLHPLCSILQYADDLVVYISGISRDNINFDIVLSIIKNKNFEKKNVEAVRDCLQTSLTRLMIWFGDQGLSLSANKSEMMIFSRKHENPQVSVRLGQIALRNVTEFKYLGIIFGDCMRSISSENATQGLIL